MKHGGDLLSYNHLYEGRLRDFSSNINPLGPPEGLKTKILEAIDDITTYPDIKYRRLRENAAAYLGCSPEEVIVGNGAVEIINNIITMFKRTVVFTPCFGEYIDRAMISGKPLIKLSYDENFHINTKGLEEILDEDDLLILGNPNNPTGRRIKRDKLLEVHRIVCERGAFLLLDEAFYEFCPEDYDSIELLKSSNNVCVIRAATKFFALPGIRLGYAFISKDKAERYNGISLPWSVNHFADSASEVIFRDEKYIKTSKDYIDSQRRYLLSELGKLGNIRVCDTDCNFILIRLLNDDEEGAFNFFIRRGILIRKASSFEGLDSSFIRVAVKSLEDNRYLVDCFREYVSLWY